jgi:hypothetical protein
LVRGLQKYPLHEVAWDLPSCSKVTFLLLFNFIRERSPFAVALSVDKPDISAPRVPTGEAGTRGHKDGIVGQKRKTIPAEGWAVWVVAPEFSCGQIKVWPFADEAPVFGAKREVPGEFVVGATAIDKGRFGLTLRAGNKSTRVARRIEDEGTGTRKDYGLGLKMRCGAVTTSAPVAWCTLACTLSGPEEVKFCCVFRAKP